jgi:hypothetical protein
MSLPIPETVEHAASELAKISATKIFILPTPDCVF